MIPDDQYYSALDLNNAGVACLCNGCYREAVQTLGRALNRIKESASRELVSDNVNENGISSNTQDIRQKSKPVGDSIRQPTRRSPSPIRKSQFRSACRKCNNNNNAYVGAAVGGSPSSSSSSSHHNAPHAPTQEKNPVVCIAVDDSSCDFSSLGQLDGQQQQQQQAATYYYPIRFQQDHHEDIPFLSNNTTDGEQERDTDYAFAAILYNLGMALQCVAKTSDSNTTTDTNRRIHKSIQLLQLSQSLLLRHLPPSLGDEGADSSRSVGTSWMQITNVLNAAVLVLHHLFRLLIESSSTDDAAEHEVARGVGLRLSRLRIWIHAIEQKWDIFISSGSSDKNKSQATNNSSCLSFAPAA